MPCRTHIKLYYRPVSGQPALVEEKTTTAADNTNWVIDYRYATVTLDADSGEMIVTFPYNKDKPKESAINLSSGVTYYFELSGIVDTSVAENAMVGSRGVTKLPGIHHHRRAAGVLRRAKQRTAPGYQG